MKIALNHLATLLVGVLAVGLAMAAVLGVAAFGDYFGGLRGGFPWWVAAAITAAAAGLALYLKVPTGVVDRRGRRVRL